MPFLFVDYDHASGGEYFCSCLSQTPQAKPLKFDKFESGRTKVQDVFGQEFLKIIPKISKIKVPPDTEKFTIVPSHRHTALAKQLLKNIKSIRIQRPVEEKYYKFLKYQQINKVLLATEPTDAYFIGFLKILSEQYNNKSFLSKVNRSMDNLSLTLLAQNIEPTEDNRQQYLNNLRVFKIKPEPNFDYDLIIPYDRLFNDPESIAIDLQKYFELEVDINLLKKYQNDFEQYQTQT